jgi:hypothetical protein
MPDALGLRSLTLLLPRTAGHLRSGQLPVLAVAVRDGCAAQTVAAAQPEPASPAEPVASAAAQPVASPASAASSPASHYP